MYAKGNTVDVPKSTDKGKVHITTNGYVYWATEWKWNPKKRVTEDNRVTIGKIAEEEGKMYPNKRYSLFFDSPDLELDELRAHYCASDRLEAGRFNKMLAYGPYIALKGACAKAGCLDVLVRVFPQKADLILGLVVHAIVARNTTAQEFPVWCFNNYCGLPDIPDDSKISRLYKHLADHSGDIQVFFELFKDEFAKRFPAEGTRAIAFDSTNQGTYSRNQDYASFGHAKEKEGLPVINTAMFVDEATGIPLWYEHYDGSLLDKSQTPSSLAKIADMGYRKIFLMFDRGYYSEKMHHALEGAEGIEYGLLCPDGKDTWVGSFIDEYGPTIKYQQKFYVPDEDVYGICVPRKINGIDCYAYLFFDSKRSEDEQGTIHGVLEYFLSLASMRKRYSEKMERYYAPKGIIVVNEPDPNTGKNFILLEDADMIQAELDRTGLFAMISGTKMAPHEAIRIIRKRDVAEKGFQGFKSHFNLKKTYTHCNKTYVGKMFLGFVAEVVLSSYRWFAKDILHQRSKETVNTSIGELAKYQIEQTKDGNWISSYAMSKAQKDILSCFDLTENSVINSVGKLQMRV